MNCLGSMALEKFFPDESSEWAVEGTTAHSVLEAMILDHPVPEDTGTEMLAACRTALDSIRSVQAIGNEFASRPMVVQVERELIDPAYPDLIGGHADLILIGDDTLIVMDFKYGVGLAVTEPDQLAVYAMLAWLNLPSDAMDRVIQIVMVVLQPRISPVPVTWVWPISKLREFRSSIREKIPAILAIDRRVETPSDATEADVSRGSWCQFCKARVSCPAAINEALEAERLSQERGPLSTDVLLDLLGKKQRIIKFLNSIEDELIRRSLAGQEVPGHKVVERMGNRSIENPDAFLRAMLDQGYARGELVKETLIGLTELDAVVGNELSRWTTRKISGRSLVPESDPRASVASPFDSLE